MNMQQDYKSSRGRKRITKTNILIVLFITILIVISTSIYNDYRKKMIKKEVEIYLKQQGYEEEDIVTLQPFRSFKGYGDTRYMVSVKLKGVEGGYNLYYDSESKKIRVGIYVTNDGTAYIPKDVKRKP